MKKQAVLIIHGIGEQRPMDTLRSFVKAVWETHEDIHFPGRPPKMYSKPDHISGNLELRRLTTSYNKADIRTDFFEYYWAHMMDDNKLSHIMAWAKRFSPLSYPKFPRPIQRIWNAIFGLLFLVLGGAAFLYFVELPEQFNTIVKSFFAVVALFGIPKMFLSIIEDYVGDAARYLDSSPKNVKKRQKIREGGIQVLKKLHESGEYDRIVIVGHSLGSVIAYDILTHAWPRYISKIKKGAQLPKLKEVFEMAGGNGNRNENENENENRNENGNGNENGNENENGNGNAKLDVDAFQRAQTAALAEQVEKGNQWLVSDLITLGSPLTYAEVLLAKDKKELDLKVDQKEFLACPPLLDEGEWVYPDKKTKNRLLSHYSLFAFTRWTNMYFENKKVFDGDIIGGPLANLFGAGIKDIPMTTKMNKGRLSHTRYWTLDDKHMDHILKLRAVLDLTRELPERKQTGITEVGSKNIE